MEIKIPTISSEQNYWFFRTEGGNFFADFYFNEFIAYGWDEYSDLNYIKNTNDKEFKKKFSEVYPDEKRPGLAVAQMKLFVDKMKKGDIVLIPAASSEFVAIGVITSDAYIEEYSELEYEDVGYKKCTYKKRRRVYWEARVKRDKIDPYLFKLMCAINTISDANAYSPYIDRMLYPLYIKDNTGHLTIKIEKEDKISALDMSKLISGVIGLIGPPEGEEPIANIDDIEVRVNVQSPGLMEFIGSESGILAISAALSLFIAGADIEFTVLGQSLKVKSPGLIEKITQWRNVEQEAELKKVVERTQAQIPASLRPQQSQTNNPTEDDPPQD